MTDDNKIEQLLATFYGGYTSIEEDKELFRFLCREDLDAKWHKDRDLFQTLFDSSFISLPEGISESLESTLDAYIKESLSVKPPFAIKKLMIGIVSATAVVLLCISLFFFTNRELKPYHLTDTYTDPVEAAKATEQVLQFVSYKLNKGLSSMDKVNESITKTNKILSNNLQFNN